VIDPASKVSEEVNRKCRVEHIGTTFTPTQTQSGTMHSITDRQTDRRQNYANSRLYMYCVAV